MIEFSGEILDLRIEDGQVICQVDLLLSLSLFLNCLPCRPPLIQGIVRLLWLFLYQRRGHIQPHLLLNNQKQLPTFFQMLIQQLILLTQRLKHLILPLYPLLYPLHTPLLFLQLIVLLSKPIQVHIHLLQLLLKVIYQVLLLLSLSL